MGLSSTTNRSLFSGDGSSATFSFPYEFFSPSDLQCFLFDTGSSVVYPQTLNTHYTVSGNVNAQGIYPGGGNIVMNCAVPTNMQLVVTRNPLAVQNFSLLQNGPISATALVQQLDYVTALVQRLQDQVSRAISLPDGIGQLNNTLFSSVLPQGILLTANAGAPLCLNSGATGWTFGLVATGQSGAVAYQGTLPPVNGGTGQNLPFTNYAMFYALNSSAMTQLSPQVGGYVLISTGSTANAPAWYPYTYSNTNLTIMARDINANTTANNFIPNVQTILATGTSTVLLSASPKVNLFTGSSGQTVVLPDATTLYSGQTYEINNNTNSTINVNNFSGTQLVQVIAGAYMEMINTNNATQAGVWDFHAFLPKQVQFGSQGLNLSVGSSTTGALSAASGGTGLSSFAPQFGLVTASNASTMGVLPVGIPGQSLIQQSATFPAFGQVSLASGSSISGALPYTFGGTGITTYSDGQLLIGNSNAAIGLQAATLTAGAGVAITNTGGSITLAANGIPLGNIVTASGSVYAAQTSDDVILIDPNLVGSIKLKPPTTYAGLKFVRVKSYNNQTSGAITTISGSSGNTIFYKGQSLASVPICTLDEEWVFATQSNSWYALSHFTESIWSNTSALVVGGVTSAPGISNSSSPALNFCRWRRHGQYAEVNFQFSTQFTCSTGSGDYLWTIPVPLSGGANPIDSAVVPTFSSGSGGVLTAIASAAPSAVQTYGCGNLGGTGLNIPVGFVYSGTQVRFNMLSGVASFGTIGSGFGNVFGGTNDQLNLTVLVPITNWLP